MCIELANDNYFFWPFDFGNNSRDLNLWLLLIEIEVLVYFKTTTGMKSDGNQLRTHVLKTFLFAFI